MVLQTLRKGASGWIAKIFLVVLTLSFVVWGIADVFRGFGTTTVASVGSTDISADAFRRQYLDQLQQLSRRAGRAVTPEQARAFGLDRQILNQMIADATLDEKAARLGLAVSDAQVAREIADNPAFRPPGATAFDPAYFQQLLRSNSITEQRFVDSEKKRAVRDQVLQSFGAGVAVPQVLLDAVNRYEGETRAASYILVTAAVAGPLPAPTEEQLRAYFDAHKITFRAPEFRKIAVLALTPAALAAGEAVSDADARSFYDRNHARFGTPEQRVVKQIVFTDAAEAKAAFEKIKAGTPFEEVATARGLSAKDTDLGLVTKAGILDPKIADAAFALAEGAVSEPVEGRFGTALVEVTKIVPGMQQPFEAVKPMIVADLQLDKARRALLDKHDAVEDERASGATLAETAQKLGLTLQVFDAVDRSGRDPEGNMVAVPGGADVIGGAFATQPGVETDTVQLPQNGGFVWYETAGITPARERTFEEAKAAVTVRWTEAETEKAIEAKAKELFDKAQAGTPLAEVAGAADRPIQVAEPLRRGRAEGPFSTESVAAVFDVKEGGFGITAAASEPDKVVFQVTKVTVPESAPEATQVAAELSRQLENDLLMQYLDAIQKEIGVKVNDRVYAQAVGAGTAN
ncbi:SurA N-terminal domain-containing protein [Xanthobacter dioxanivorans]|uniref:Parvulin-like PPIase n=1 Tax=Xanthobacter dioxanivorans TaxID=2528964 RepID=A0A974SIL7_9HYPH|nr:peptidylprolyl isomerase [Xanthobacter dioxanivorans]QRG05483.1 SurA N-terminal domain-containing protein [Xanthobacter dioxanivorans]